MHRRGTGSLAFERAKKSLDPRRHIAASISLLERELKEIPSGVEFYDD